MTNDTKPIIAERSPSKAELKAGEKYFWCACGRSSSQPFCDGSHRGSGITPLAVSVDEDTEAFLCRCKATANPPYCDGSHARLGAAKPGDVTPQVQTSGPPKAVPTPEEPTVARIHAMARDGLAKTGHHGEMGAIVLLYPTRLCKPLVVLLLACVTPTTVLPELLHRIRSCAHCWISMRTPHD